jgi:hypothetical protein
MKYQLCMDCGKTVVSRKKAICDLCMEHRTKGVPYIRPNRNMARMIEVR